MSAEPTGAPALSEPVVSVRDLHVDFRTDDGPVAALRGVDLDIAAGEIVALVGESGSGKSVFSSCLMGLPPVSRKTTVTGTVTRRRRGHDQRGRPDPPGGPPAPGRGRVPGPAHLARPDDEDRRPGAGTRRRRAARGGCADRLRGARPGDADAAVAARPLRWAAAARGDRGRADRRPGAARGPDAGGPADR